MLRHSLSSLENYTRFQTKMGKVYTPFQTKTGQKPYPLGRHILREYPTPGGRSFDGGRKQVSRRIGQCNVT